MINSRAFIAFEKGFYQEYFNELYYADPDLKADLAKISFFLKDEKSVIKELEKLENRLALILEEKALDKGTFLSKQDTIGYKVISSPLMQWGNTFFKRIEKTDSFIPAEYFLDNLNSGVMLKDIGATSIHGEWSHFIQWYLLAHNDELKNSLSSRLQDIYASLGETKLNILDEEDRTLWFIVFDNNNFDYTNTDLEEETLDYLKQMSEFNFSCPEYLNFYLCKSGEKFPILSKCIYDRFKKRNIREEVLEQEIKNLTQSLYPTQI